MSKPYATPLFLELNASPVLAALLWLIHGSAVLIVFLLDLPLWLQLVATILLVCSLTVNLGRHASRCHPQAIDRLVWSTDQQWFLHTVDRNRYRAILLPPAFVQPYAVILSFRTDRGQTCHVFVAPDMLSDQAFRKLRVRLQLEMR